jgi:predicted Na+-dependent transporter
VAINFIVFISSTLAAPFTLPAIFEAFGGSSLQLDTASFFRSLLFLLLLPFLLHLPVRRVNSISNHIKQYGGAISTIFVALIMIAVVGQQRNIIYRNPNLVIVSVAISMLVYLILHASGWYLAFSNQKGDKIALSVASGVNQLGLGISLAFLHFPATTSIFMVSCNFAWIVTIALSKWRIGAGAGYHQEKPS